jgi:hypothetical protein
MIVPKRKYLHQQVACNELVQPHSLLNISLNIMCNYIFVQQGSTIQPNALEIVNTCCLKLKNLHKN